MCSACGGENDSSSASTTSYLRLVNATQVDNLSLSAANGSLSTSATSSRTLSADVYYTVMAYARGGQIKLPAITDIKNTPTTGFASMSVANADSDAGALDIYVVTPGASQAANNAVIATTIGGTSLAALTSPSSGGDYTILAYGVISSPQVAILTDNNQPPIWAPKFAWSTARLPSPLFRSAIASCRCSPK